MGINVHRRRESKRERATKERYVRSNIAWSLLAQTTDYGAIRHIIQQRTVQTKENKIGFWTKNIRTRLKANRKETKQNKTKQTRRQWIEVMEERRKEQNQAPQSSKMKRETEKDQYINSNPFQFVSYPWVYRLTQFVE